MPARSADMNAAPKARVRHIYLSVSQNGSDHDTDMMVDVGSDQEDHSIAENIAKHIKVAENYDIGEYGGFLSSKVSFSWLFYVRLKQKFELVNFYVLLCVYMHTSMVWDFYQRPMSFSDGPLAATCRR
ncbi:hypothetical protein Hanom_Chr17g01569221 [Helianthus anomalus]